MDDLALDIAEFLRELESPYLIRHQTGMRCRCIDPVTLDARADCTQCGGDGLLFQLVPVSAAKQLGTTPESYPFLLMQGDLGRTATPAIRFYMRPGTKIATGDEVWEVAWQNGVPIGLRTVYKISYVDRVTAVDFRDVYIRAYGHTAPERMRVTRFIVKRNAGLPVYEPVFGGGVL